MKIRLTEDIRVHDTLSLAKGFEYEVQGFQIFSSMGGRVHVLPSECEVIGNRGMDPDNRGLRRNTKEGVTEMTIDIEKVETKAVEMADRVWGALSELHQVYYCVDADVARQRQNAERTLERLMVAYDLWLG